MTRMNSVKHTLFALGLGVLLSGCPTEGGGPTVATYNDIQSDLKALTCTQAGCHNATATNKLKIDTTVGKEMDNYNALFTNQLVIKMDATNSALIKVPSTGMGPTTSHVKTLTGTKLTTWQAWVNAGAPF